MIINKSNAHKVGIFNLMVGAAGLGKIPAFKTMRTLRALRPLRAMSRLEGMRVSCSKCSQHTTNTHTSRRSRRVCRSLKHMCVVVVAAAHLCIFLAFLLFYVYVFKFPKVWKKIICGVYLVAYCLSLKREFCRIVLKSNLNIFLFSVPTRALFCFI